MAKQYKVVQPFPNPYGTNLFQEGQTLENELSKWAKSDIEAAIKGRLLIELPQEQKPKEAKPAAVAVEDKTKGGDPVSNSQEESND